MEKINILSHYKKLWFFTFNRLKDNNYQLMREYFAEVLIEELEEFISLENKKILDVGGARGEFCKIIFDKSKSDITNLDPYPGDVIWEKTVVGFADKIPFPDNEFDLIISRGVLEHIVHEKQQESLNEMYRVTKQNGICYIMIPPWYSPNGGHALKPFHVFPFKIAKALREFFFRNKIDAKSYSDIPLYPVSFSKMLKMIKASGFKILATRDTHFKLHFVTKIPGLREVAVLAAVFILQKK
ncbi:class I SAM-dependent methyltransferase [Candidatus Desantisbacteria bacterium]|nr:class I SAM-dependent methyltransferase [Candidatus Desantisbacteria bacterium]